MSPLPPGWPGGSGLRERRCVGDIAPVSTRAMWFALCSAGAFHGWNAERFLRWSNRAERLRALYAVKLRSK